MKTKIYIASKTKHYKSWLYFRATKGVNFVSTWIDHCGKSLTDLERKNLAQKCIEDVRNCDIMIVYAQKDDYLNGAFIEMGMALALRKKVYLVGAILPDASIFTHHPDVYFHSNIAALLNHIAANE